MKRISNRSSATSLLKALAFTALLTVLLGYAGAVLKPARTGTEGGSQWSSYQAQRKGSVDVLFFGTSHVFDGVDPSTIWRTNGIPSFVLGGPTQRVEITKYYVKEALRTQQPRVVVMELSALNYRGSGRPEFQIINVGYMPPGLNRAVAAFSAVDPSERMTVLVDLWGYHSRWNEVTREDFDVSSRNLKTAYLRGYLPKAGKVRPRSDAPVTMTPEQIAEADEALAQNLPALEEIARICEVRGIELVLLVTPTSPTERYSYHLARATEALTNFDNVSVIDLGTVGSVPGLSYKTDFFDPGHVNFRGSEKVSREIATRLREEFDLPDRRGDERYAGWNADAIERDRFVEALLSGKKP